MRNVVAAAAAFALVTLIGPPAFAKDWRTVTVATEGAYVPWNLTTPDGRIDGFEPELLRNICGRLKIECKIVVKDWSQLIPTLHTGEIDVIMDAMSISAEREKLVGFTVPYASTPTIFVTDKTGPLANAPGTGTSIRLTSPGLTPAMDALRTAFKGKTIGLLAGTIYETFIMDNFKDVATIREFKSAPEHDEALLDGKIDVAFDDATYFAAAFSLPNNVDLAYTGPEIGGGIWGPGEAFGMRQSDQDLVALFNGAIKAAIQDGTLRALSLKWFKADVTPP